MPCTHRTEYLELIPHLWGAVGSNGRVQGVPWVQVQVPPSLSIREPIVEERRSPELKAVQAVHCIPYEEQVPNNAR